MNLEPVGSQPDPARSSIPLDDQPLPSEAPSRAAGAQPFQKKFVILATPRSGSSHLIDLLDSHPQLCCLGELYNPKGAVLRKLGMRNKPDMTQAGQVPLEFLDRVMAKMAAETGKPCFGFKLMLQHDPRMIDHVLDNPEWTVIVLERRNLVAQWTSAALAKKTGQWGGVGSAKKSDGQSKDADDEDDDSEEGDDEADDSDRTDTPKVMFDAKRFEQYCYRMHARYSSIFHRLGDRPHFRLMSEDIDASHDRLLEFLGVDPNPMESSRPRQNSSSMRDRIKNYHAYYLYAKKHSLPT